MTGTWPELPERALNIICISLKLLHTFTWNPPYHIVGNFGGVQFLWIGALQHFAGSIFLDARDHASMCTYKRAYFMGLIFAVGRSTTKVGPLENFLLYSIYSIAYIV